MLSSTRYRWQLLRAGPLWLDGGGMFGIVPRALWSKLAAPDERGRIELSHNCLLLSRVDDLHRKVLIETGSGDKFDPKNRDIFGLTDRSIVTALQEAGTEPEALRDVVVSHLHFDHAGGLTRRAGYRIEPTFPNATIHIQRREWDDANANNSVMTRTYLKENLDPIRDRLKLWDSPRPYEPGHVPVRDESPRTTALDRLEEVLPGIFGLVVPGHTWGQQAILFCDDRDQTVVFTPDVMPTANHLGAAYNMAYDVEPYVSSNSRRWFLHAAAAGGWTLVIDHEPGDPVCRVQADDGWFKLAPGK